MKLLLAGLLLASLILPTAVFGNTFTVNWNDSDSSDYNLNDNICDITSTGLRRCTLRAAIEQSNHLASLAHTINFDLGTTASDAVTITLSSALPTISCSLTVNGSSAAGYNNNAEVEAAPPRIYLRASNAIGGSSADGFRIFGSNAKNSRIIAIGFRNFPDNGIEIINTGNIGVYGNWIGVTSDGFGDPNDGGGVYISNCQNCKIGPDLGADYIGNVISNSGADGVYILTGSGTVVSDNLIGGAPIGSYDFGNGRHGIYLQGPGNKVGYGKGNTIVGNEGDGIFVFAGDQLIVSNVIRLNDGNGVSLNGNGHRLGNSSAQGNEIYLNGGHGVELGALVDASDSRLSYNEIYQNNDSGIYVKQGNTNEITGNVIYDNNGNGIGSDAAGTHIQNNQIGLNGSQVVGGAFNGIVLNANNNTVANNKIAAMEDDGIDVISGDGNQLIDNEIGMSEGGVDWGNNTSGVYETGGIRVRSSASNTLIEGNFIGFNSQGILLEGSGTEVCGNHIGVGLDYEPAGNLGEGVFLKGSLNTIGNVLAGCALNFIGFNQSDGIEVWGDSNTISDNYIGGYYGPPQISFPNGRGGILFYGAGAWSNFVSNNQFRGNGSSAVRVYSNAGNGNRIEKNSMWSNGAIGIDLNDDGVTPNDPGDIDFGPNNLQNSPVITDIDVAGSSLTVSYRVDSGSLQSVYPLSVDFYFGYNGQGRDFLHRDTYSVAPNSVKDVVITLDANFNANNLIAVAIDTFGNTSEFSGGVRVEPNPLENLIFKDSFE